MWAVILGSHLPYHASACWVFTDEPTAQRFAAFVTSEIDPAQVIKAADPVCELLNWRDQIASRTAMCEIPGDCPNGPGPHAYVPDQEMLPETGYVCCRQPSEEHE
jgi:hypothetical protein